MAKSDDWWLEFIEPFDIQGNVIIWKLKKFFRGAPPGFETDLGSIPSLLWGPPFYYTPWGPWTPACIPHDFDYITEMNREKGQGEDNFLASQFSVHRKLADDRFYKNLINDGVSTVTAKIFYRAVRLAGGVVWYKHTAKEVIDAQQLKKDFISRITNGYSGNS